LRSTSFQAGEVIAEVGRPRRWVVCPVSGLVSARAVLSDGRQLECALVGKNNAAGLTAALGGGVAQTHVVCLTPVTAWTVPMGAFQAALQADPVVARMAKRFSDAQVQYTLAVGVCNAMHSLNERAARWLCLARDLDGPEIRAPQEEVAHSFGVQRSALNPVLQRMQADRLVALGRARIEVRDPQALRRLACGCVSTLETAIRPELWDAQRDGGLS
jgi:CRP-like cAMP-binding protein